jgi:hypothetical protein
MATDKRKSFSEQLQLVGVQIRIGNLNDEFGKVSKAEVQCPKHHKELKRGERCICGFRNKKV